MRHTVTTRAELIREGLTYKRISVHESARRWQGFGSVVVRHNGPLNTTTARQVALFRAGRHARFTSFTSAEMCGLRGWERDEIHLLVPSGTKAIQVPGYTVVRHFIGAKPASEMHPVQPLHRLAPSLVIAASSFRSARPAAGILSAAVQQRLLTPAHLREALEQAPRTRHRHLLLLAVHDIEQGAHALSEIDFVRLCRRHSLPRPTLQAVRIEPSGRRRYLDAEWVRSDGRRVAAEVDGAVHLAPRAWWADQIRQNELVIADDLILRWPSSVMRAEEAVVVDQLRRALQL